MEKEIKEIIAHTLGVKLPAKRLPKQFKKNMFVAGDDHPDISTLRMAKYFGWMECTEPRDIAKGARYWYVTVAGAERFRQEIRGIEPTVDKLLNFIYKAIWTVGIIHLIISLFMAIFNYHSWVKFGVDTFMVAILITIIYIRHKIR